MAARRRVIARRAAPMLAGTVLAGTVLAGTVLAGCGSAPGTAAWPAGGGPGVTITILTGTDTSISAGNEPVQAGEPGMYQQLADWWNRYEAPRQHIRIQLAEIPGGANVQHSEMLGDAEDGTRRYDIYNLDNDYVAEFAAAGYIRALGGHLPTSGFLAKPLESGEDAGGRLYAAPFTTDVGLLYYRTDLVSRAELAPVRTLDGLIGLANQAKAEHPGASGLDSYAGQFSDYEGLTVNLLEIIRGYDPQAFAPDGAIRDPGAVQSGLQAVAGAFTSDNIPAAERGYAEAQAVTAFATGNAVFMRNWPIYYAQLRAATEPGTAQVAGSFSVVPLPFPSVLGGQDLAIAAASPHPAQALTVVEYLTSAQAERCLFAVGGFPATRRSAYAQSGALPDGYGAVRGHPLCGTQAGRELAIAPVILRGIGRAIRRPVTRYYTVYSDVFQEQVSAMLSQASPGAAPNIQRLMTSLSAGLQAATAGRVPPA
jgi:multiple sugar transport system substrate-binding protein